MHATVCVAMLALCLIALQCAADGEPDKPSPPPPPPPPTAKSGPEKPLSAEPAAATSQPGSVPSQHQSQDQGKDKGQGQGQDGQKGPGGGDNGGTDKSGVGTGEAARSVEPSPSTVSSVSSSGSSSQGGATGLPAVPDSSTETTTTIKPQAADDNNKEAPKDEDQLLRADRTSILPSTDQDPQTKINVPSSQTTQSDVTLKQSPEPPLPPTLNKEGEEIQGSKDNLVHKNGHITTTVTSEDVPQTPLNVNPISNLASHSSTKGGDPQDAAEKPITDAIPPPPPLPGQASTPSNPAKPPVSSTPLQTNGNTNTGQNTDTNIKAPQTNTPPTLAKVKPSINQPQSTSTTNTAPANTIKPSTNSATVPAQDQAAPNSEEKELRQPQTSNITTLKAVPTGPKETSVTSTTESAKEHSSAPAPPLPKLSTSLQSLDIKDSSIGSVSLFSLTTLATLAVTVVLPAS